MEKRKKVTQLNKFLFDVRAEVAVAHWFEKTFINEKQLYVKFVGQHERGVGKDIKKINYVAAKEGRFDKLVDITLNRDSIYDTLPEVLFHHPKKRTKNTRADNMAEDYRERKAEETVARTFFNPFDQGLFLQRVFIEQQEAQMIEQLNQFLLDDEFYDFLYIDSTMPNFLKVRLLCFLPYLDKIIGNIELTQICLSLLIDFEVWTKPFQKKISSQEQQQKRLGNDLLGIDTIMGHSVETSNQNIEFNIRDVPKDMLLHFLHKGYFVRLFDIFNNYFIPLEMDTLFKIHVQEPDNRFLINETTPYDARLSYTTHL